MYPRKKFSRQGGYVIAEDAAHERALGPEWMDNPPAPRPAPAAPVEEPAPARPNARKAK